MGAGTGLCPRARIYASSLTSSGGRSLNATVPKIPGQSPKPSFGTLHATLCLLYAFPLLLLADNVQGWLQVVAGACAVAFTGWGVTLYLWSGVLYLLQVRLTVRAAKQASPG